MVMSFVSRKLGKLSHVLSSGPNGQRPELLAAQQALAWALDPHAFKSPLALITGTQEDSGGCSVDIHRSPLPDTDARMLGAC